jgi:hypothetical protein
VIEQPLDLPDVEPPLCDEASCHQPAAGLLRTGLLRFELCVLHLAEAEARWSA